MANDYYNIIEPGDPFENRVANEKFVNPETRDVYPPEDPASEFPDLNAHENIDTIINNQNTKDFFQLLLY